MRNVAVHSHRFCATSSFKSAHYVKIHALLLRYYCRKYIDNYPNTSSDISACLGLFLSCLSDRLVDIVSDLPLFSPGIIVANPSPSGIWLLLLYLSVSFLSIPKSSFSAL